MNEILPLILPKQRIPSGPQIGYFFPLLSIVGIANEEKVINRKSVWGCFLINFNHTYIAIEKWNTFALFECHMETALRATQIKAIN